MSSALFRNALKRVASRLPAWLQNEMKRAHCAYQIRRNRFDTDEKEYALLKTWVGEGDWVLDVGANIGQYSARLSELVGNSGRVIAFEPVPATFALLAANAAKLTFNNVTLLNVAASNKTIEVGIEIPKFETGLDNYYMAHLTEEGQGLRCLTLAIDSLQIPVHPKLIKIDAEGHELAVLQGMPDLIQRCHPVLLVEDNSEAVDGYLLRFGYSFRKLDGSSNKIYEHRG